MALIASTGWLPTSPAAAQSGIPAQYSTAYPNTGLPPGGYSERAVPQAPLAPQSTGRPTGWPSASPQGTGNGAGPHFQDPYYPDLHRTASAANMAPHHPTPTPVEGARILAKIDADVILYSEVAGPVNQAVQANIERYGGQLTPEQENMIRDIIIQSAIKELIPNKLLVADARRNIPAENMPKVMEQFEEKFDEDELPKLIKNAGVRDQFELDAKLRTLGTSLSRQKRAYVERTLGQQWLRQQLDFDREIPRQELLAYYQEHAADYEQPAQVRWQQLMKRPARYESETTKAEMAELGNQLQRGAPFDQLARAHSEGPSASQGGWFDWTTIGGDELSEVHLSRELEEALLLLPINRLSRIIEDNQGYHIVRVLERQPATRTPFEEVRAEIEEKLRRQDIDRQVKEYLARLQERATIWTVFDDRPQDGRVTGRPDAPGTYRE